MKTQQQSRGMVPLFPNPDAK